MIPFPLQAPCAMKIVRMWRLIVSGKVFEGGPCTPFDPAPPGLKVQEGQGEEAVSISVFIEQV